MTVNMCISVVWVEKKKKSPDLTTHFFMTCYCKHTYFFIWLNSYPEWQQCHHVSPTNLMNSSYNRVFFKTKVILAIKAHIQNCTGRKSIQAKWVSLRNEGNINWTASSEFGTYSLCEQRRFRRACAYVQSRQNLRCSLIQAEGQEEPSDRKPDPWPLWMAGHAQLKFVMTECSKTQIRLTGLNWMSYFMQMPSYREATLNTAFDLLLNDFPSYLIK